MERIRLSKEEKLIFRNIISGHTLPPSSMNKEEYADVVAELIEKGLVLGKVYDDNVSSVRISRKGRAYFRGNPHLYNPINWNIIQTIGIIITAIVAIIALFVACAGYLK